MNTLEIRGITIPKDTVLAWGLWHSGKLLACLWILSKTKFKRLLIPWDYLVIVLFYVYGLSFKTVVNTNKSCCFHNLWDCFTCELPVNRLPKGSTHPFYRDVYTESLYSSASTGHCGTALKTQSQIQLLGLPMSKTGEEETAWHLHQCSLSRERELGECATLSPACGEWEA